MFFKSSKSASKSSEYILFLQILFVKYPIEYVLQILLFLFKSVYCLFSKLESLICSSSSSDTSPKWCWNEDVSLSIPFCFRKSVDLFLLLFLLNSFWSFWRINLVWRFLRFVFKPSSSCFSSSTTSAKLSKKLVLLKALFVSCLLLREPAKGVELAQLTNPRDAF